MPFEEAQAWVEEYKQDEDDFIDIKFMEVSAKEGLNIDELFEDISKRLLERHLTQGGTTKTKYVMNEPSYLQPEKSKIKVDDKGRFQEVEENPLKQIEGEEEAENKGEKKDKCWKSC